MSGQKNIELDGLEQIGHDISVMHKTVVTEEAQTLVNIVRQVMEEDKVTASYALVQSIEPRVYEDGFDIVMDEYWKFVNEGVQGVKGGQSRAGYAYKGKKPPISAIKRWESFKKTYKNVYALREVVYKYGIKPRLFIDKAIEKYLNTQ